MTAKFEAFKAALHELCIAHGVRLRAGEDYDDYGVYVEEPTDEKPAGLDLSLDDVIEPTPEERAAQEARREQEAAEWRRRCEQRRQEDEARYRATLESKDYQALQRLIEADAKATREQQMRVSTDPTDPAYVDERPRRVWCNDVEILGWTVADEFRRCVITPDKVHNGAVRIERLPDDYVPNFTLAPPPPPINSGFAGMLVSVPDVKPAAQPVEPAATAAAPAPKKTAKRRRR